MLLYDNAPAPNAWRVRIFLAEKGVDVPKQNVDVLVGEARTADFLKVNSLGEVPVLRLDDGRFLTESVAICRYLESLYPDTPLFGRDATEQAFVEMWSRRMELHLMQTIGLAALHSFEFFADKIEQIPALAAANRKAMKQKWAWFDAEMADGRAYAVGDDFTVADIAGMAALRIASFAEESIPDGLAHAQGWADRVQARDSWNA